MAEEIENSTSKLTDKDLAAMASYLKSVPGSADSPAPLKADAPPRNWVPLGELSPSENRQSDA
jgi:hypothetical protein